MPRDGSPSAIASLPCSRQSSDSRAGCSRSRSSGGSPSASVAWRMSSCWNQASASAASDLERLVAGQAGMLEGADQQRRGVGAVALLKRFRCLGVDVRQRHGATVYSGIHRIHPQAPTFRSGRAAAYSLFARGSEANR